MPWGMLLSIANQINMPMHTTRNSMITNHTAHDSEARVIVIFGHLPQKVRTGVRTFFNTTPVPVVR